MGKGDADMKKLSKAKSGGRMTAARRGWKQEFYHSWPLYLLLLPSIILAVIFCYAPMGGLVMAFQNYKPRTGILHSEFVGLEKFRMLFSDMTFIRVIRNTLAMGVINLVVTFFTAIAFAVLLNEIKSKGGKKVVQTISYLPHFLSWIIVTGILHDMLSGTGIINE